MKGTKKLDVVDFLKGYSIFTIVLMHLMMSFHIQNPLTQKIIPFGGAGVHVFILCSGFGLYLSYLNKSISYLKFLKVRFLRVYLPYIVIVTICLFSPFYFSASQKWEWYISHVFLYKMFFEDYETSFGAQLWFVSTIIQFYLAWPIIIWFFKKTLSRKWLPVIIAICISLLWSTLTGILHKEDLRIWNSFFLQYLWEFVVGMSLALYYKNNNFNITIPKFMILALIGIIGLAITGYMGVKGGILKLYNDIPSMLAYLSIALIIYKMLFLNKVFEFTNKFSYEWYLVHLLVFAYVSKIFINIFGGIDIHPMIYFITAFLSSYLIGYLYMLVWKKITTICRK